MRQKDFFVSCCWLLCGTLCLAAVHDELPQCGLQGVYRQRQSLIESPNYPDNYPPNSCVDYVIRSPYRCPTKFHIQFLDFQLELSENCSRDYLAIGLQNADDDMAVLCGQVLGIRKYHTPDGILRLRFLSDDSPWTTNGGFRLLITRLACEREDLVARGRDVEEDEDEQDDTVEVNAKLPHKKPLHQHHHQQQQPPHHQLSQFPHNFSLAGQQQTSPFGTPWPPIYPSLQPYPAVGYPPYTGGGFAGGGFYLPVAPQQTSAAAPPCNPNEPQQQQQQQHLQQQQLQQQQLQQIQQQLQQQQQQQLQQQQQQFQQQLPAISDQYQTSAFQPQGVNLKDYDPQSLQQFGGQVDLCCVSSFNQAHFYLSSPGFPRTVLNALLPGQQRDCVFYLEKNSPNVAGLRIQFKFFDFGQSSAAAGGIYPGQSSAAGAGFFTGQAGPAGGVRGGCNGDFIELDGQRYCGCRSGHVHKSFWPEGRKALRLRMGQSGGAASNGFLLEIFQDQDTDSYRLDAGAIGGAFNQGGQRLQGPTGLPGITGLAGLPGLGGLQGLNGYQPQLGPQLGLQPQLGYRPQTQLPLWPSYLPHPATALPNYPLAPPQQLLPFTPYRQSRQASWQYARGLDAQQPARIVETNSTRKEFYYFDADEAFARAALDDEDNGIRTTTTTGTTTSSPGTVSVSQNPNTKAFEQSSCSFDYMEVLRLTVDTLWLTKPICFAPVRSWFSNIFG